MTLSSSLFPPSGAVVSALHERYSYDFSQLEPLIAPRANFGTFRLTDKRCGDKTILVVRIPGADRVSEEHAIPLEVFKEALWTIYGSLAALEFKGLTFRSISLPVLAGRRDYLITDILPLILESAIRWLRSSKSTEDISLYVYEQMNFSEWYQGMDHILGRKYFDTAKDSILNGLRQELLSLLKRTDAKKGTCSKMAAWTTELADALGEERLRFQSVALLGRKLAEFLVKYFSEQLEIPFSGKFAEQIRLIRDSKKAAPWVANYLNSLKDFGNEHAHLNDHVTYRPRAITHDDLLALLCGISRLTQIWLDWDKEEGTES